MIVRGITDYVSSSIVMFRMEDAGVVKNRRKNKRKKNTFVDYTNST